MSSVFRCMAQTESFAVSLTRLGLIVVLLWIGGLKVAPYEADGIVPFVAESPFMNFLMNNPADYRAHMNPEGKLVPENRQWHQEHGTYTASHIIGAIIVSLGILLCFQPWLPQVAAIGGLLVFGMSLVTLSFLITTPQVWVPNLGDAEHGFPYLSGRGRLVIKDVIMMGAALVCMADSAKKYLRRRTAAA
ncbi:MAG: YkgB family protein [Desulfovibrio sp.]|nr:YkgB family protein [Desulfovibrio sp.]